MATLNAIVIKSKEGKNGKNKVRISVAHNGETRYIVTDIVLASSKEFKNGAVVKRPDAAMLNTKIRKLLQHYQSVLDDLQYIDGLTCPELVFQLKNAKVRKHRTLKSVYEEYVNTAHIKPGTVAFYRSSWNALARHLGENMLVEHINHFTVLGLDKNIRSSGVKNNTIKNYIVLLKILVKYAERCGYVQYRINPFAGYKLPPKEVRESWLAVEDIRRIRDLKTTKRNIAKCRDLFMLSYYLGGINITDLIDINFDEHKDVICYVRKKTDALPKVNKFVEFAIPDEAKQIIERWKGADGRLNISDSQRRHRLKYFFERNMKHLASLTGIKHLIYYSARKSFSQHAFELGINTSVIDYILGHSIGKGGSSLYHYVFVTPEKATEAVRQVLDNLK